MYALYTFVRNQSIFCIQFSTFRKLTTSTASFEQRDFVIRELIDTETNYLEVLNALKYKFMQPMEKVLSKEETKSIYPKIKVSIHTWRITNCLSNQLLFKKMFLFLQELVEIHTKFLEKLHDAVSPNSKTKLSSVFLEFREPFLIYGEYCSNMTNATDTLRDACKKSQAIELLVQVWNNYYIYSQD